MSPTRLYSIFAFQLPPPPKRFTFCRYQTLSFFFFCSFHLCNWRNKPEKLSWPICCYFCPIAGWGEKSFALYLSVKVHPTTAVSLSGLASWRSPILTMMKTNAFVRFCTRIPHECPTVKMCLGAFVCFLVACVSLKSQKFSLIALCCIFKNQSMCPHSSRSSGIVIVQSLICLF